MGPSVRTECLRLQSRIDWFAFQGQDSEHALVHAAQRFTPHKFTKWLKTFALHSGLEAEEKISRMGEQVLRGITFHQKL